MLPSPSRHFPLHPSSLHLHLPRLPLLPSPRLLLVLPSISYHLLLVLLLVIFATPPSPSPIIFLLFPYSVIVRNYFFPVFTSLSLLFLFSYHNSSRSLPILLLYLAILSSFNLPYFLVFLLCIPSRSLTLLHILSFLSQTPARQFRPPSLLSPFYPSACLFNLLLSSLILSFILSLFFFSSFPLPLASSVLTFQPFGLTVHFLPPSLRPLPSSRNCSIPCPLVSVEQWSVWREGR